VTSAPGFGLEARLARLGAAGARAFDPPGFRCVAALLERARALGGSARVHLEGRAAARIDLLEDSLRRGRADAEAALRALADAGLEPTPDVRAALERGDLRDAARSARRRLRELATGREKTPVPWLARLRAEAEAREIQLPPEVARDLSELDCDGELIERRVRGRAQALATALSSALFRDSLGSARAALAVARAVDGVPEGAGPYNPQALAARALQAAEALSPTYVQALLEELDDLAALEAALAPPPKKPTRQKPARKPARKTAGGAANAAGAAGAASTASAPSAPSAPSAASPAGAASPASPASAAGAAGRTGATSRAGGGGRRRS